MVGVHRFPGFSTREVVEGLELFVGLDDSHPVISAGWEVAVDGREVFERLGF